jgi:hypothetical protein
VIKKKYIFIEILLLIFLFTAITLGSYYLFKAKLSHEEEYHVVFHDIDGLIVGSPVRLMGVDVGHVRQIQNIYDDIHLVFVINNKKIKIPKNAVATVQFTGIAGSKSLEILPLHNSKQYNSSFVVIEPIRINKAFSLQNAITESVVGYTRSISDLIGNKSKKDICLLIKQSIRDTYKTNKEIDRVNAVLKHDTGEISKISTTIQKTLLSTTDSINIAEKSFTPSGDFSTANDFNSFVKTNLNESNINDTYKELEGTHKVIKTINYEKDWYERSYQIAETIGFYLKETSKMIDKTANFISKGNLDNMHKRVKEFKKRTEKLKE